MLLRFGGREKELWGGEPETTNNRMELTAAIEGLAALTSDRHPVVLTTDSRYVMDGITSWLPGWKKRGWKTASRQPVKNEDLWRRLDQLNQQYQVEWRWVRGHSGHAENERVDRLANRGIDELKTA